MRPSKTQTFLTMAAVLSMRSTCARKRVGCVLVDGHYHIVGTGYNGPAAGEEHCTRSPCPGASAPSGEGYKCEALHAEWNALLQAPAVYAISTAYVTTSPCLVCTKLLMNTGCKTIYYIHRHNETDLSRALWQDNERKMVQIHAASTKWVAALDESYPSKPDEPKRYCDPFVPDTMSESHCMNCGQPRADHPVELTRDEQGRSISVAYKKELESDCAAGHSNDCGFRLYGCESNCDCGVSDTVHNK